MSQISNVRIRHVYGTIETEGEFWEDRLVMPLDVYEEFRVSKQRACVVTEQSKSDSMEHDAYFIQIENDDGAIGIGGPVDETVAYLVDKASHTLPAQPRRVCYRVSLGHHASLSSPRPTRRSDDGYIGRRLCPLGLEGQSTLNVPVYTLLGGPTRDKVPAYASMLGFNVTDMALVRERAAWAKSLGYTAQKWFFRYGPMSDHDGFKANVAIGRNPTRHTRRGL